jgi:hypothetical protein
MKRVIMALLLATCVGGVALAQAPPEPQSQPATPPSDSRQTPPASTGTTDEPTLMKQCVAQQHERAASSGMSNKDIKEFCKAQVKEALQSQTPR